MPDKGAHSTPEQLRARAYQSRPYVFHGLRGTLSDLQSIARTYARLQKYEVTMGALNAIGELLAGYLAVRDGDLLVPSSVLAMFGPLPFEFDEVLTESLEGIAALHKASALAGDEQLSQQIIDVLRRLALRSVDTRPLFSHHDENPTTAFIAAYLQGGVEDGARRGLDDTAMAGASAQGSIGRALLKRGLHQTAQGTVEHIERLAYLGVAQRKPHVTGGSVRGIAEVLAVSVTEASAEAVEIEATLSALQRICEAELQFKLPPLDQSLRFALGAFLDITQPTALANIERLAAQRLIAATETANVNETGPRRRALEALNERLWDHLASIGVAAAKTESFALFYINSNIAEITKQCLWLLKALERKKPEAVDQASAQERRLLEEFSAHTLRAVNWVVGATYWRIFDALEPPVKSYAIWDFFPTLSDIGIQAIDAKVPSVAEAAISELQSISIKAIEKPIKTRQNAARIAAFAARIGITAQKTGEERILRASVAALREFEARYLAVQMSVNPEAERYDATLINEIEELKHKLRERRWYLEQKDANFFGRVAAEDIDLFVALLRNPA